MTKPTSDAPRLHATGAMLSSSPQLASFGAEYSRRLLLPVSMQLLDWVDASTGTTPLVVAVSGWPGAGKSTLVARLSTFLSEMGIRVASFSLDDLYLERKERLRLAERVHPLCRFRGVPGTHDLELGFSVLERLNRQRDGGETPLPRFDKWRDDRLPCALWPRFFGRPDLIVIDNWFWNIRSIVDAELEDPLNEMEARHDSRGVFRRAVNAAIEPDYPAFFSLAQHWIELRLPNFDVSVDLRLAQERKLCMKQNPPLDLSPQRIEEVRSFMQLLERVATTYPSTSRPDVTVELSERQDVVQLSQRCSQGSL